MAERSLFDQLDDAVSVLLAQETVDLSGVDSAIVVLAEVAEELRGLPRENFRVQLRAEFTKEGTMSTPQKKVDPIPRVYPAVSPYLCFDNAAAAIEFYKNAFGAEEQMRLTEPSGKIGHAEIKIGDAVILLSDEYPDYGAVSPKTLGGSPVKMHILVEDVDSFAKKAVEAGASIVRPIEDQFYGDRTGQISDPFGYTWIVSTPKEDVSVEEMQRRLNALSEQQATADTDEVKPPVLHTITPYITVKNPAELIEFLTHAFGATEKFRTTGSAGGMHAELNIRDSVVMVGGAPHIEAKPTAIHLYVPDVDDAYRRSVDAGATSIFEPQDQPYGERGAAVEDLSGNRWYIATTFVPLQQIAQDLRTVTMYFHPIGAQTFIDFVTNAFGGKELMRHAEEGTILHAKVQIGDSVIELGEARYPSQPLPSAIYMHVPDVDSMYEQAVRAGGISLLAPTDQDYGDRSAWIKDPFDNVWYLASPTSINKT